MKPFTCLLMIQLLITHRAQAQSGAYHEPYRPQFHFTPATNWTNDPNGLVYFRGEYHLFFQHNPFGNRWGHMSWGHSVSRDLVHWQHLPLAIPEENHVMIFSGSVVVDEKNSSGFAKHAGDTPLVAIYTGNWTPDSLKPENTFQSQFVAYSLDAGRTWTKYNKNPVLDLHKKDFRDPCVFWYAPQKKWVMALVFPQDHIVQFYASVNLVNWTHLSDFGPAGDIKDIWECPSLLQIPVNHSGDSKKWVLFNSQQTTMQYFVGEFDGTRFISENPASTIFRPDYGPDFYAGITYNHLPVHHPPILVGWANNWSYANDIPTSPWKSMMSIPRELSLEKTGNAWILLQKPVAAFAALKAHPWQANNITVTGIKALPVHGLQGAIELEWEPPATGNSGIRLAAARGNAFVIGYDPGKNQLFIDRRGVGDTSFNQQFARLSHYVAPLVLHHKKLRLDIYMDRSVIEVFANDGEIVMTAQLFPGAGEDGIELFSEGGESVFSKINYWEMNTVWQNGK